MHDIVFIHPPAFIDFYTVPRDYGPISDVIPSQPIFDCYPIGFVSLLVHLEKCGFRVRIVNLAAKILQNPRLNVMKTLKNIKAKVYAIDLHWLVHLNSSLYIARQLKEIHDAPIILGGLSATYFWKSLIRLPYIDYIVRGDTTEEPMRLLMDKLIDSNGQMRKIPNLVWKQNGKIIVNSFNYVPEKLEAIDYGTFVKCAARDNFMEYFPFANFMSAPITSIITAKGCTQNCIACGGSKFSYEKFFNRKNLAIKPINAILEELNSITSRIKASIFFIGDLQQTGRAKEILRQIAEEDVDNVLIFEFFKPPSKDLLELYEKAGNRVLLQISPESHDTEVRVFQGRPYTTAQLITLIKNALRMKFERIDVYFMIGLAKQTYESAIHTAKFAAKIISKKVDSFIAPLAPFIDPGSLAFENPERYGYKIFSRSLWYHSKLLLQPIWYDMLNYKTEYLTCRDIARATYAAVKILLNAKYRKRIMDEETYHRIMSAIKMREEGFISPLRKDHRILAPIKELYPFRSLLLSLTWKTYTEALSGFALKFRR